MKCPICPQVNLAMSNRQGIEIDYCPECRGVWLDRGELDKILERSLAEKQPSTPPPVVVQSQPHPHEGYYRGDHDSKYYKKKHKSFLSELFD